jgi:hypothetical protein
MLRRLGRIGVEGRAEVEGRIGVGGRAASTASRGLVAALAGWLCAGALGCGNGDVGRAADAGSDLGPPPPVTFDATPDPREEAGCTARPAPGDARAAAARRDRLRPRARRRRAVDRGARLPPPGVVRTAFRPGLLALLGGRGERFRPGHGVLDEPTGGPGTPGLVSEAEGDALAIALGVRAATLLPVDGLVVLQSSDELTVDAGSVARFGARLGVGEAADAAWTAALGRDAGATPALRVACAAGDRVEAVRVGAAPGGGDAPVLRARCGDDGEVRVPTAPGPHRARAGVGDLFEGPWRAADVGGAGGDVTLDAAPSGTLRLSATAGGLPLPVRARIRRLVDGAPHGDDVRRVVVLGDPALRLPPGAYRVAFSRGMEYDVVEVDVDLAAGEVANARAALDRVGDTTGWIGADFHLHTDLSTDSAHHVVDAIRVVAAEGLDLVASTDHDFVTDYGALLARAGVEGALVVMPGTEVSSTVLGHIGGYPLRPDPDRAGAGSPQWFDRSPRAIFDALRARGDGRLGGALVQINHPRLRGAGFFDVVALDRESGRATEDAARLGLPATTVLDDFAFDVLEVWNGYTRGGNEASFEDYLALYAAGRPFTMVGNSDCHRAALPAGAPRTYLRVDDDSPGGFGWEDAAAALRSRAATVAAGIFVTAALDGPITGDAARLRVRVQAAPWVTATRLRVYAGRSVALERGLGRGGPVRLDETLEVPLAGGSGAPARALVVRVDGDRNAEPVFGFAPFGITNPIDLP